MPNLPFNLIVFIVMNECGFKFFNSTFKSKKIVKMQNVKKKIILSEKLIWLIRFMQKPFTKVYVRFLQNGSEFKRCRNT